MQGTNFKVPHVPFIFTFNAFLLGKFDNIYNQPQNNNFLYPNTASTFT